MAMMSDLGGGEDFAVEHEKRQSYPMLDMLVISIGPYLELTLAAEHFRALLNGHLISGR